MIDLKRCNYITGTDKHAVSFGLSRIVDFFETAGWNPILISQPKNYSDNQTTVSYLLKVNQYNFKTCEEFEEILETSLFRVDLIIVDLWKFNLPSILQYKKILDTLGINYIIISDKYHYVEGDPDTNIFRIDKGESNKRYEYDYIITEMVVGWKSTVDNLIKTYRRDKKIDDLFGNSED